MEIKVDVPNGKSGKWSVETFVVSKEDAKFDAMRACISSSSFGRCTPEGTYKALRRNGYTIMSNTPDEIRDFSGFIWRAKGNVLINGLGLGVVLKAITDKRVVTSIPGNTEKPQVEHVTVIEISQDVINLVGPSFKNNPRVEIICADAYEWIPPKGVRYDAVWNDIWDNICTDNLEGMGKLHRKYGRRADWVGSWGRELCQYQRRREKRSVWG